MGLCSSSNEEDLARNGSWASTDSANSNDSNDYGPTEENQVNANLFGMRSDPDGVMSMLRTNSASLTRLTDAKAPRGSGHVSCHNQCGKAANDAWCTTIASHLSNNTNLTELHFGSGHHVGDSGAKALATALKINHHLLKLSLVYGTPGLGAQGTTTLAEVLPFNDTLEILDLTSNAIGNDGAVGLSLAFLPRKGAAAREALEDEAAAVVTTAEAIDSQLTFDSVDTVWRPNDTLRSLLLSGNGIGTLGAVSLSNILKSNHSITNVNLTDNSIGDEGAQAISEGLLHNSVLHTIGLGNNKIGSAGAIALSAMLESNEALQRLTLDNKDMHVLANANKIAMEGIQALAKMLTNNRTLKFLILTEAIEPMEENGHDTQKSVRLLANALETSNTCIIKLETNPVYDPKLERLLNRNMQTHRASQKLKAKLKRMRSDV